MIEFIVFMASVALGASVIWWGCRRVPVQRPFYAALFAVYDLCCLTDWVALRWPVTLAAVLGTLAVIALATIATVSVLVYARLKGVNLHYLDFEMRNRRVQAEARNQRPPYGMQ